MFVVSSVACSWSSRLVCLSVCRPFVTFAWHIVNCHVCAAAFLFVYEIINRLLMTTSCRIWRSTGQRSQLKVKRKRDHSHNINNRFVKWVIFFQWRWHFVVGRSAFRLRCIHCTVVLCVRACVCACVYLTRWFIIIIRFICSKSVTIYEQWNNS